MRQHHVCALSEGINKMEFHIEITRPLVGWLLLLGTPLTALLILTFVLSDKGKFWINLTIALAVTGFYTGLGGGILFVFILIISSLHFIVPATVTDCPLCTLLGIVN